MSTAVQSLLSLISVHGLPYAKPPGSKTLGYGTAGFRTRASELNHILFRVGLIAGLRSKAMGGQAIGLMITASHNPEEDNGAKLVDPKGEMLAPEWEGIAARIANAKTDEELGQLVQEVVEKEGITLETQGSVFVGRDTRESSPRLGAAAIAGIQCFGGSVEITDFGIVTTPLVHYLVVCANDKSSQGAYGLLGPPVVDTYYSNLSGAFIKLMRLGLGQGQGHYIPKLTLDPANGVGAPVAKRMLELVGPEVLDVTIVNDGSSGGVLNFECGADYVKTKQRGPKGIGAPVPGQRYVSFDGDADRVIYFYFESNGAFRMLDGDKIAVLFARHLRDLLVGAGLDGKLSLGLVQTAYANGASTKYIEKTLGIPVTFTPTGVKYLEAAASTSYDIGIYFEANGHGTVHFSSNAIQTIHGARAGAEELWTFVQLINSYVGDALSDMLVVEAILCSKGWNVMDWDGLYTDLPQRLLTVRVQDRYLIQTADAERTVVQPQGVQEKVQELMNKFDSGRAFVRPSGTEDIVRVYAEAKTKESADELAILVGNLVYETCGGVGERPKI